MPMKYKDAKLIEHECISIHRILDATQLSQELWLKVEALLFTFSISPSMMSQLSMDFLNATKRLRKQARNLKLHFP